MWIVRGRAAKIGRFAPAIKPFLAMDTLRQNTNFGTKNRYGSSKNEFTIHESDNNSNKIQ